MSVTQNDIRNVAAENDRAFATPIATRARPTERRGDASTTSWSSTGGDGHRLRRRDERLRAFGAKDPLSLVLQRSDMPAKAKYTNGRLPTVEKAMAAGGIASSVAFHHSNIQRSLTKMDTVSGMVVTLKTRETPGRPTGCSRMTLRPSLTTSCSCLPTATSRSRGGLQASARRSSSCARARWCGSSRSTLTWLDVKSSDARAAPGLRRQAEAEDRKRLHRR